MAVLARDLRLDPVGTFFVLFALSSLGIRLIAGKLYDALGLRPVLTPGFLVIGIGMAWLATATDSGLFLLAER